MQKIISLEIPRENLQENPRWPMFNGKIYACLQVNLWFTNMNKDIHTVLHSQEHANNKSSRCAGCSVIQEDDGLRLCPFRLGLIPSPCY